MSKSIKAIAIGVVTASILAVPVPASAESRKTENNEDSTRVVRVFSEKNCPNGKGKSEVLSPGEYAPFRWAGSVWQGPQRTILWNWSWITRTKKKGKCYNIYVPLDYLNLLVHYKKASAK